MEMREIVRSFNHLQDNVTDRPLMCSPVSHSKSCLNMLISCTFTRNNEFVLACTICLRERARSLSLTSFRQMHYEVGGGQTLRSRQRSRILPNISQLRCVRHKMLNAYMCFGATCKKTILKHSVCHCVFHPFFISHRFGNCPYNLLTLL